VAIVTQGKINALTANSLPFEYVTLYFLSVGIFSRTLQVLLHNALPMVTKMNIKSLLVGVIAVVMTVSSCEEARLSSKIKKFQCERISFPSDMTLLSGYLPNHHNLTESIPKLVVYIDSMSCSTCRIGQLPKYHMFYENALNGKFQFVVIIKPKAVDIVSIRHVVNANRFCFDAYIDNDGSFAKANPTLSLDRRFHTFYADSLGFPKLVGDPTVSRKMEQLYLQYL